MKIKSIQKFRYLFIIAVIFLLINSVVFMIAGAVECVQGYVEFTKAGFKTSETLRPGTHLLEGLDYFVSSFVFMIFGLGLGQLFLFDESSANYLPRGLRINSLIELKIILWETILVALVIFCVTHLLRADLKSWDLLPFPVLILILSLALFLVKFNVSGTNNKKKTDGD